MKQENRMSLELENTLGLGKARVTVVVYPPVIYNGKLLDLTSVFNLVKSRTPLYYVSEDPKDNFCRRKFIPTKLVYKQDENGNETVNLYDADGNWSCYHPHYTDPNEAVEEWYKQQMVHIERARAEMQALLDREANIEVMRQLNENQ